MKYAKVIFIGLIIFINYSAYKYSDIVDSEIDIKTKQLVQPINEKNMKLGAFSVSLNVKDIHASKQFYENLGFSVLGGALEKNYLIMKNENSLIGLFQGMFEGNILTFNPGWDESGKNVDPFNDVREIQQLLKEKDTKLDSEIDTEKNPSGPANFILKDPDGNMIYFDQHR